jgi:glycosyl transferase, family 25
MLKFVISLKEAEKRRKHIEDEFNLQEIPFSFFDAVNKSNLNQIIAKFGISFDDTKLTVGEKSCFLSHVVLWNYCVENELKYIAIYEDDVVLSVNSHKLLKNFDWIPKGLDIIKLEKFEDSVLMLFFNKINIKNCGCLRELKQMHIGTAGYIVSLDGAKKLLNLVISYKQFETMDELLFNTNIANQYIKVYQMIPAIVMQIDRIDSGVLPSQLQDELSKRVAHKEKIKKIFFSKIKLEVLRVFFRTQKLFCKIGFE